MDLKSPLLGTPCYARLFTRVCLHASVYTRLFTRVCLHASVYTRLFTRVCLHASVYTQPAVFTCRGHWMGCAPLETCCV